MKKSDYYYNLPEELIAQVPIKNRESSRLLVMDKKTGNIEHKVFTDIINYINTGDTLVINDTKVIPARLIGKRDTGSRVEILLLKRGEEKDTWEVLTFPGKKARIGHIIYFGEKLKCEIIDIVEDGNRVVKFYYDGIFEEILDELGEMPLPPYIKEKLEDKNRYQTIYAKYEGSSAAPTAGLHFTEDLIKKLEDKGVNIARLTLHVGLGTFRPVKEENILEHKMHEEYVIINKETADLINKTKKDGKKIIAVGTTSTRALEAFCKNGILEAGERNTDIFIYPGYEFQIIDGLITNFHLPESTLLMLVSGLSTRENILNAYEEAIKEKYRFFSFGDAMLII